MYTFTKKYIYVVVNVHNISGLKYVQRGSLKSKSTLLLTHKNPLAILYPIVCMAEGWERQNSKTASGKQISIHKKFSTLYDSPLPSDQTPVSTRPNRQSCNEQSQAGEVWGEAKGGGSLSKQQRQAKTIVQAVPVSVLFLLQTMLSLFAPP